MTIERVKVAVGYIIWPVRVILVPVQSVVRGALGLLDLVLDEIYWRFDLWSVPPTDTVRGQADYSKVRGFFAFWIAVGLDVWFFIRTRDMPVVIALLTPLGLLAYSFGERVFIAFLKTLPAVVGNWRGKALAESVNFSGIEARRASVGGDHEPTD